MILCFKLSMPNVGSWDGKWSGIGRDYSKIVNFGTSKKSIEKAREVIEKKYYNYNFGDGWSTRITVSQVNSKDVRRIRKQSKGFCGYDWMVDSIIEKLKIGD